MATSEDVTLATRWILERMEQDQNERREWHTAAMAQNDTANAAYRKKTSGIFWMLALRPLIELAILVVLIVKL
jgi:hypothetical protein